MFKSPEEIRAGEGLNQSDMARKLGLSPRSYQYRITDELQWTVKDLVRLAEFNDGELLIDTAGKRYQISIKEV